MKNMIRRAAFLGLSFVLTLCVTGTGLAQSTNSGDLRGTVTDASGAVVPDVTVTVEDVTKNVTHTYTTNDAGLYDTGSIVPDDYIVTFTKPGFGTYVRGPLTLNVGTSTVNGSLKVGSTSQRVVVTSNIPLLQTETGAQSTTMTAESMAELPNTGAGGGGSADWQNFVVFMAGTSGAPQMQTNTANPNAAEASVNGNLPYNDILADGATATLPQSQNADHITFETVAEVKVDANSFSAQYGVGGVIYNQISKGGGSHFHGAAYEYFQNDALNAAAHQFTVGGRTRKQAVSFLRYNNYGGSISGPILKNRMFFYFNYDKTKQEGGASTGLVTVPTAAERAGDFTGLPTLYDPTTQVVTVDGNGNPVVTRQSFASEYPGLGNKIPVGSIDSVANAIQAYYPAPNTAGSVGANGITTNNYFFNVPSQNPFTKYFGRLDFDITPSNRLTVSETESDNPATFLNQGICPINCQHGDVSRDNAQVSDVWTITPSLLNEARMGFTDQLNFFQPYSLGQDFPAKLGWNFAKANTFPDIQVDNYYELQPSTNAVYKEFVFDPSDVVTLIKGRHVLHFGGEFLINRGDSTAWGNLNAGTEQFHGGYTAQTPANIGVTGSSYADFLLGYTEHWSARVSPEYGARIKLPQAFVQDDIKVRPNLTVNLGLRWQGITGWSEIKGNEAVFDPTVANPATQTLGAIWYGSTHANGRRRLEAPVWNTFLPRVGFSYLPAPNTTIRGGFGLFAYTWSLDTYGNGMGAADQSNGDYEDPNKGALPVVILSEDGSVNHEAQFGGYSINQQYIPPTTDPSASNGGGVSYQQYHTPVPKIYQYNLQVQRELGNNMVVEVAYVGSHAFGLGFPTDINQVPENKLGPNVQANRPYTQYQSISGSTNNAISNYNSLQAQIQKRMANGLQFNFNYTWSKFLDDQDSSGWGSHAGNQPYQRAYRPSANYGPSNFDIRNMLKGQVVYELPFGKGRRFLNNNVILDELIGGWQTAATVIVQGGNPYTVTVSGGSATDFSGGGNGFLQYPNVVGNPNDAPKTLAEWFNPNAYAVPAPYTFGNSGRNTLYGPSLKKVDFSLGKNFIIWRSVVFNLRADAYNVFNHPSYGQPNASIGSGSTGQITSTTVGGRSMQLFGRVSF